MKKITFVGATGMLGQHVAHALIEAGFDVTILARNLTKTQQLFPKATIISGDLANTNDLHKALAGQDAVYLNLSVKQNEKATDWHSEEEGIENVIEVAKLLNVKRIAYLSSLVMNYQGMNNFDWWAFRIKQAAVQKIKASGLAYTIFYPSTFFESYQLQIAGSMIQMAGRSKQPMWFVSAKNFGRQVAQSFKILKDDENREYIIQGTEAFDYQQANAVFAKNYSKKKLKIVTIPMWVLTIAGKFMPKMNYLTNIMEALNNYPEQFDAQQSWQELGKPETTLAQFAKEY
jgi:uncharacterized protein YbjT (DUF2867 family)